MQPPHDGACEPLDRGLSTNDQARVGCAFGMFGALAAVGAVLIVLLAVGYLILIAAFVVVLLLLALVPGADCEELCCADRQLESGARR